MSNPSNFNPLFTRLNEMFVSGSGVNPTNDPNVAGTYSITTGSFDTQYWYQGRENEAVATNALYRPQLKFSLSQISIPGAWNANYFEKLYNITLAVDVAFYTNAKLLKEKRQQVEQSMLEEILAIVRALTKPNNLTETEAAEQTGMISGCFLDNTASLSEIVWDPELSLLTGRLTLDGKIVLSNVVGS